jgi:nitrogen regulatory protein P-II 1
LDVVVLDSNKENVVQAVLKAARTGMIGDGKIFISTVESAVRIRTEEKGDLAV